MEISTRNWINTFQQGGSMYGNQPSYYSSGDYNFGINHYGVQKDDRFDPMMVTALAMAEPIFMGIFTKIANAVNGLDQKVYEIESDGKPRESKKAKDLLKWYNDTGREQVENQMLVSAFGTGMGGGVCFPTKKSGELNFRFEPYILEGRARVGLYGDNGVNNEVTKVVILDNYGSEIPEYSFEGSRLKKFLYHYKYINPNGSNGFGSNGLIGAMRAISLRRAFDQANEAMANNGMKQSGIVSLDPSKMLDAQGKGISGETLKAMAAKTRELLKMNTGIHNAGGILFAERLPITFTPNSLNNSQNRTIEYKKINEEDVWLSYAFDKAFWMSENSKYNNLEIVNDQQFKDLKAFRRGRERVGEFCLSFNPKFEPGRFVLRTSREFSSEEINLRQANTKDLSSYVQNLKILQETYGALGHSVLPSADKLAFLESQGIVFKPNSEPTLIQASDGDGIADDFTQVTSAESINRSKPDFMDNLRKRVNKSFESVLNG
jgi:hypothetical protein